ncbi:MAG: PD-(D/E)XK nuclease family transposase [Lachnospiraceae bacterium]|nr:PD-(D/E)XK nuclease family transposase [Lachnospiraceae bacterium]MBP3611336.1 PD-(D/E)XK nuclease family transposase [Lachnospiraceae bacterium]
MIVTNNSGRELSCTRGDLPYKLTNEYLFRAVFQSSPKALEGLCRAVLRLSPEDSLSVSLQNPVELGKRIEDKDFLLQLAVTINNSMSLTLELQVCLGRFCKEHAFSHACRGFDQLNHDNTYDAVFPIVHADFLNFSLFPEHPEFYASYQLMNISNPDYCYAYSDKLLLSVVDLTQIALATEEDKAYDIDLWARVFTASTWREIEMLAQNNDYLQAAVSGLRQLLEDEAVCQQCQAREEFSYREQLRNSKMKELDDGLKQAHDTLRQKEDEIAQLRAELAALKR